VNGFYIHFAGKATHSIASLVDVAREALRMAGERDVFVVSAWTGNRWTKPALMVIVEGKR
jgi:hypothetical protein